MSSLNGDYGSGVKEGGSASWDQRERSRCIDEARRDLPNQAITSK